MADDDNTNTQPEEPIAEAEIRREARRQELIWEVADLVAQAETVALRADTSRRRHDVPDSAALVMIRATIADAQHV